MTEEVISYVAKPQEYFHMNEVDTRRVAELILPILMGDTWHHEDERPMTNEEARNVGYLLYPLGHHNWMTFIHKDNFQTYAVYTDPQHMARAKHKVTWHCPFSFKQHQQFDCQNKLFTCAHEPSNPTAPLNYTLLRDLDGDTENQLAVLKFFELMDTIYQVKNGHVESLKVTPNLLDLCCKYHYT